MGHGFGTGLRNSCLSLLSGVERSYIRLSHVLMSEPGPGIKRDDSVKQGDGL